MKGNRKETFNIEVIKRLQTDSQCLFPAAFSVLKLWGLKKKKCVCLLKHVGLFCVFLCFLVCFRFCVNLNAYVCLRLGILPLFQTVFDKVFKIGKLAPFRMHT